MWFIGWEAYVIGGGPDRSVVLNYNSVVKDRDARRGDQASTFTEPGRIEYDIVRLPFTCLARSIDQRHVLLVDGTCLAIRVRRTFITVQYLQLVFFRKENTAVAAGLPFTG